MREWMGETMWIRLDRWGGEGVVDGLEGKKKDVGFNTVLHREPVELLNNTSDMIYYGGFGDDVGVRVLN